MISTDINVKMRLRRVRRPIRPSTNNVTARYNTSCIGIGTISLLLSEVSTSPQVVGAYQPGGQKQRCEFHPDGIRPKQRNANLFRCYYVHWAGGARRLGSHIDQLQD